MTRLRGSIAFVTDGPLKIFTLASQARPTLCAVGRPLGGSAPSPDVEATRARPERST